MLNKKQLTVGLVGAGLLWCLGAPAHASYGSSVITTGSNTFEDQSREAYFDNGDGLFGVGDILTGYIRIDDKTKPNSVDLENHIYAIFSQQVIDVQGTTVVYGAVNPAATTGLSLSELGVAGALATDMVALYSSTATATGYSTDMILNSPGDRTGNGTVTLADYFDLIISEGVLDIRAGLNDGPLCTGGTADCFAATSGAFVGAPNSGFIGLPDSITVANFVAGLETSLDPAGYVIEDVTPAGAFYVPLAPVTIAELAISNGAVRGSFGVANYLEWTDGSELSALAQCTNQAGQTEICGFVNDADFTFYAVPEPASIALMGLGLFGLGAARRRQRRQQS